MRSALACLALTCLTPLLSAQEKTVLRYVEFRDGSILRLPVVDEEWSVTVVESTGKPGKKLIRPSQFQSVTLTDAGDFAKKQEVLSAVQQLGSANFQERERSWEALVKLGPDVRPDLEACLKLTADLETQLRLKALLKVLPPAKEEHQRIAFDQFAGDEPFWGHVSNPTFSVSVAGQIHKLTRTSVKSITTRGSGETAGFADRPTVAGFRRINEKDFPPGCLAESFENNAAGVRFPSAGANIEREFLAKGFVMATPAADTFVAINSLIVAGKSHGYSVGQQGSANKGEMVLRFVQPGVEHVPAAVSYFGCWAGAVVPGGTELIAYDVNDQVIGKLVTQESNSEFLGFASVIPVHKIRIVPNSKLGANVVLDDFLFLPAPVPQVAQPGKFAVRLAEGDLIFCKDVTVAGKDVLLTGLAAGLPDLKVTLDQVERINFPRSDKGKRALPAGVYVQLTDGSTVFGGEPQDKRKQPVFPRHPKLLENPGQVAGVWRSEYPRLPEPLPEQKTAAWYPDESQWKPITFSRVLEEVVMWKKADGDFDASGYAKLPPVWLKPPAAPTAGRWHVQTVDLEDLVLPADQAPTGQLTQPLNANWQGQSLRLPVEEVVGIYRVRGS